MNSIKVTSTIKKIPLNYLRSKKITKAILQGFDKFQVHEHFIKEDKIEIESFERRREIVLEIYRRIISLDTFLQKQLLESDIYTSKFILVYAIAKNDILFREFLSEVYRNTLLSAKRYISMDDFRTFFIRKKESYVTVNKWSITTVELLSKGYRQILTESNLGIRKEKNIYVNRVNIHPIVFNHIKAIGDSSYLQVILGDK